MNAFRLKQLGSVGLAAALVCGAPGESQAFWNWFRGCCGGTPVAAVPVVAAPAVACAPSCDPCQQTVAYVPQTSYRVQYVSVPVTTYRPVNSCNLCSGTQTTYMQPVTSYQTQAQMAPYTSYRLVYSAALPVATTSYYTAPVAASVNYAPAATVNYAPAAAPGCNGCSTPATTYSSSSYAPATAVSPTTTTYATPTYAAPAPAASYPAQTYSQPNTASTYLSPNAATSPTPAPAASSNPGAPQPTYAPPASPSNGSNNSTEPTPPAQTNPTQENRQNPIPDHNTSGEATPSASGPTLSFPSSRTTQIGSADRWAYSPVQAPVQTVASRASAQPKIQTAVDDGGWRPSR